MPAPEHLRLTMSGTIGTSTAPVEEFSWGLSFSPGSATLTDRATLTALAEDVATRWSTSLLNGNVSSKAVLRRARVAYVGDQGRVIRTGDGAYLQGDFDTMLSGGGTTTGHPPQVALVVSLFTATPGLAGRGRFFLPMPAVDVGDDMLISEALTDTLASNARSWCSAAEAAFVSAGFGGLVLASGGAPSQGVTAALRPVTEVRVGRALDTLRSRRKSLQEDYSALPYPF